MTKHHLLLTGFYEKLILKRPGIIILCILAAIAFLATVGITEDNSKIALRLSARIAFVLLLVIFVARPLQQMFATPFTAKLLRNRRLLGVAFAGIHTAHLGLIFHHMRVVPDFDFNFVARLPGMLTYGVVFLMFATSFNATTRMLGPARWRILHKVGLYWLFIAFVQTQLPKSLDHLERVNWFLIAMIFVALVIRLTAYLAKRQRPKSE